MATRENFLVQCKQQGRLVEDFGVTKVTFGSEESFGELFVRLTDYKYVEQDLHGEVVGARDFRDDLCNCASCSVRVEIYDNFKAQDGMSTVPTSKVSSVMNDMECKKIVFFIPHANSDVIQTMDVEPRSMRDVLMDASTRTLTHLPPKKRPIRTNGAIELYNDMLEWFAENHIGWDAHAATGVHINKSLDVENWPLVSRL